MRPSPRTRLGIQQNAPIPIPAWIDRRQSVDQRVIMIDALVRCGTVDDQDGVLVNQICDFFHQLG